MSKMSKMLKIARTLSLPLETVTGTHVVLGRKRTGKTYKAKILCEEMLTARQQVIVIDPTDAWWGLRSNADGDSGGYPITIFGGRHSDLPLDPTSGVQLARAIVEEGFSAIVCLRGLSHGAQQRFVADFLEELYRVNVQSALHVFVDEADMFAPQNPQGDEMRSLGAVKNIVLRAGIDGIGITLISQRSAHLSKSCITQCDTMIALALSHPLDLKPIEDWARVQVKSIDLAKEMMEDLPELPKGEAWVWSPHHSIRQRVTFRALKTFDSSRTPKPGEKRRDPKVMSKVDLERLGAKMAESIERAKESDPKHLRAEVARLKKANEVLASGAERSIQAQLGKTKIVEMSIIKPDDRKRLEACAKRLESKLDDFEMDSIGDLEKATNLADVTLAGLRTELTALRGTVAQIRALATSQASAPPDAIRAINRGTVPAMIRRDPPASAAARDASPRSSATLGGGARRILVALAQRPSGLTNKQIGVRAGLSSKSGTFSTYISRHRTDGLIEGQGLVRITDAGISALGSYTPLPTGRALADYWIAEMGGGAARILQVLIDAYPLRLQAKQIGELAQISHGSGTYSTYISRLRSLELIDGRGDLSASPELFA